jgi:hypothetical protein
VSNTNDPPSIVTANLGSVNEDALYSVDYDHTDIDGDSVTWSLTTDVAATWLSINLNSGVLSGTPANADVGSYLVNITADDGNGGYDYTEFTLVVSNTNDAPSVPNLIFPSDDSTINITLVTFSWVDSTDPDIGDAISSYTLQYSSSSDFSQNVITITDIIGTSYQVTVELEDRSTYHWRVEAFDSNSAGSGYQIPHFVFDIETGYLPPTYNGRLKSDIVENGGTWSVNLDDFFSSQTITVGLVFTSSHNEVLIDPVTHIASWKPADKNAQLTDVTFTISDGITTVTSQPIDLSVEKEAPPMTIWERILWPYPLLSLVFVFILVGVVLYRRKIYAPQVERVFLIHEHSILITHQSVGKDHELDEDILSGMLAGVKNLISDAFGREEGSDVQEDLRKLEFGDRNILLERGNHFFIAVVFSGRANKELAARIKSVVNEIEERYTNELKGWEGYTDAFEGIDEIIATLLPKDQSNEEDKESKEVYVEVPDEEKFYGETKDDSEEPQEEVIEELYEEEIYDDSADEVITIPEEIPAKEVEVEKELIKEEIVEEEVEIPEEEIPEEEILEEEVDIPEEEIPEEKILEEEIEIPEEKILEEEIPEEDKEIAEDELDEVLKDYVGESEDEEPKFSHFPPPPLSSVPEKTEKTEKSTLPSLVPFDPDEPEEKKEILSEEEKSTLPPPPWLEQKTKPDPILMEELEEQPKEPQIPIEEDEVLEEKPKTLPPPPPPPKQAVKEEYEYECPSCGTGISLDMSSCPICGAEFQFEVEEVPEDLEYECPSCGAPVSANMTKCPTCGVHFKSE